MPTRKLEFSYATVLNEFIVATRHFPTDKLLHRDIEVHIKYLESRYEKLGQPLLNPQTNVFKNEEEVIDSINASEPRIRAAA